MALKAPAMSMLFTDQTPDEQRPEQYHLLRKLAILLLLVASASLWMYILMDEGIIDFATGVQEISAGVCIALIAGLSAQLVLSQREDLFRFVAAMTGDVAGVYLLGFVSDGKYGISQFGWLPKAVDYDGLNLIGIGCLVILFVSLIFRRTRTVIIPEPRQASLQDGEPEVPSVQIEPSNHTHMPRVFFPRISLSGFLAPDSHQLGRPNGRSSRGIQLPRVKPMVAPKRVRHRKNAKIQLALVEEHRCPFCLELVSRTDPGGVMECKVCHTLHHKDCWEITGSCQVPHLNT